MSPIDLLVTVPWLSVHLQQPRLRIVDCRYTLGQPGAGYQRYLAGHIPGTVHLDVDADLATRVGPGRHPIPTPADFARTMGAIGVDAETRVIAYDDCGGAYAARLWWLLRYFGHRPAALLDGGWTQWVAQRLPIETARPTIAVRIFTAVPQPHWVVQKDAVRQMRTRADVVLLDARAPERYRGEREPIDAQAGHIPGAINAPWAENLNPEDHTFKHLESLRAHFRTYGCEHAQEIVAYCGSGVTACHNIFVLQRLGLDAKLYEGSWSEWSADTSLPVACGAEV